ncbi:MAG: Ig-like domain-containing protein [Pirellulales bacterium]
MIRNMFLRAASRRDDRSKRRLAVRPHRQLIFDPLEDRRMLSAGGTEQLTNLIGYETATAVDPNNPDIVVTSQFRTVAISTDGGVTFPTTVTVTPPLGYGGSGGDPTLAFDDNGNLFFGYLASNPAPANANFSLGVFAAVIDPLTGNVLQNSVVALESNTFQHDKEWIAVDAWKDSPFQDNAYLVWSRLGGGSAILFSRTTDGGQNWSAAQTLNGGGQGFVWPSEVAVAKNGDVWAGWHTNTANTSGNLGEIRLRVSSDGGQTFQDELIPFPAGTADINDNAPPNPQIVGLQSWMQGSVQPRILLDPARPGNVYVISVDDPDDDYSSGDPSDIVLARSTDYGANWTRSTISHAPFGTIQVMPTGYIDEEGNIAVTWYDTRAGQPSVGVDQMLGTEDDNLLLDVYATVSVDGGLTWSNDFKINEVSFDPDLGAPDRFPPNNVLRIGEYNGSQADSDLAFVSWTANNGSQQDIAFDVFSISSAFSDRFEANNTIHTATNLGSPATLTLGDLTIDPGDTESDVDFYRITALATGHMDVGLRFIHRAGDVDLQILDSDGDLIASSSSSTDDEHVTFPVVTGEEYLIRVNGSNGNTNSYTLETANVPVQPPISVVLTAGSDTGMFNNDNVTNDVTSTIFVLADLSSYAAMGIPILDAADAATGNDGVAVEVFANGVSVGYADPRNFTNSTIFEYTFTAGELSEGLNFITSAVRVFDAATPMNTGRTQLSPPLLLTLDTSAPFAGATIPDMLASSDSGMFDDDDVTNKMSPAFEGLAEAGTKVRVYANGLLVGQGVVGSDSSDGVVGDGLGRWEVTVEPLVDNKYTITVEIEDMAGNVVNSADFGDEGQQLDQLMIWIDTIKPNTAFLDLLTDSGRNDHDNITNVNQPTVSVTADDTVSGDGNPFPNDIKFRIYDRPDLVGNNGEVLVYDSFADLAGMTTAGFFGNVVIDQTYPGLASYTMLDGQHNLKLEVEDRAGNISDDFLLDLVIDTVAPDAPSLAIDPASSDTGVLGQPAYFVDQITSDTDTKFIGVAEADALVRLYADAPAISEFTLDLSDEFDGQGVAVPLDGNQAEPMGQFEITTLFDLNDENFFPTDGRRQMGATAEDVAGNVSVPNFLDIFVDTRGPQVADVSVTHYNDYSLFDPKPSVDGPTPLVYGLDIDFVDAPIRVLLEDGEAAEAVALNGLPAGSFVYPAVNELLATTPGNYRLVGDHTGHVLITDVAVQDSTVDGDFGRTRVTLYFAEPLPDDRFTLTVFDTISDNVGNALDGESQAASPFDEPGPGIFPSGDLVPGGDFTARFTVDTRPEIGTYAYEAVHVDTNGNFVFDPEGEDNDQTNRDLAYQFGFTTDVRFAGNFADGGAADGFDKLAAYGFVNGQWRWLIDTDNDGVPNINQPNPLAIHAFPVAGNFNSLHPGDEVGLFTGTTWYFDVNGDFVIDNTDIAGGIPGQLVPGRLSGGNMVGYPIVGDFDGDGLDDLATWDANKFMFDLAADGLNGFIDAGQVINFGFPGVVERPVAADMDGDGIDDIGLWAPEQASQTPGEASEWYFLLSNDFGLRRYQDDDRVEAAGFVIGLERVTGTVNTLNHPFSPAPLGNDLFAQFGDIQAIPIVGNFDPPVATGSTNTGGGQGAAVTACSTSPRLRPSWTNCTSTCWDDRPTPAVAAAGSPQCSRVCRVTRSPTPSGIRPSTWASSSTVTTRRTSTARPMPVAEPIGPSKWSPA